MIWFLFLSSLLKRIMTRLAYRIWCTFSLDYDWNLHLHLDRLCTNWRWLCCCISLRSWATALRCETWSDQLCCRILHRLAPCSTYVEEAQAWWTLQRCQRSHRWGTRKRGCRRTKTPIPMLPRHRSRTYHHRCENLRRTQRCRRWWTRHSS